MRRTLLAGLVWIVTAGAAYAQFGGGTDPAPPPPRSNHSSGSGHSGANGHDTPAPPPLPQCADLGIAGYAFVTAIPGAPPLADDEIALQWVVRNGGNAAYTASNGQAQTLTLEYNTPSGQHQVASMAVPTAGTGATNAAAGPVTLAPGQSWRGYLRASLAPAARRWQLHLKLSYTASTSIYAAPVSDCDSDNNEITLSRPS